MTLQREQVVFFIGYVCSLMALCAFLEFHLATSLINLLVLPALLWGMRRGRKRHILAIGGLGLLTIFATLLRVGLMGVDEALLSFVVISCGTGLALHGRTLILQRSMAFRESQMQQQLLENLIKVSPTLLYIKDTHSRYLLVSESYASMLGKTRQQIIGLRPTDLFSPQEAERILNNDQAVLRTERVREFEESAVIRGMRHVFLDIKAPFYDANGLLAGVTCSSIDITERKLAEDQLKETENQFEALAKLPLVGIYVLQNGALVYVNNKLAEMSGYPLSELFKLDTTTLLDDQSIPDFEQLLSNRLSGSNLGYTEFKLRHRAGHFIDVVTQADRFIYRGEPAIIGILLDVSDKTAAQQQLQLTAQVFANASEGIVITDANFKITAVNRAFSRITEFSEGLALGKRSRMFSAAVGEGGFGADILAKINTDGSWQGEMIDRRKSGTYYPAWLSISVVRNELNAITHYVGVFTDITARKQTEERLYFLANHDALTELPNRTLFLDTLHHSIVQAKLHHEQLAVLFIDLDRFKIINDTLGHTAGDLLLKAVSERLTLTLGEADLVARLGGDEFTVLLERTPNLQEVSHQADRILHALSKPFLVHGREFFITCSIGISLFPNDGEDSLTLLKNADVAMYRAKEVGKNTYQFFAADMNARAFELLVMENSLRHALDRREISIAFQPQVRLSDNKLIGVEALMRWQHPDLGLIPPSRFIPLAEETGLIVPMGEWMLITACQEAMRMHAAGGTDLTISVNLSARQFDKATLVPIVLSALQNSGLPAHSLELEITESMIMQQPEEALAIMEDLTDLGVKLAIDDFGTGYSSLSHLKRFPLHTLKIDRSFVEGLPNERSDLAIAETIITLGKHLGMTVIAEGVETAEQAAFLERERCEEVQGFLYAKALPVSEFEDFLRSNQGHANFSKKRQSAIAV